MGSCAAPSAKGDDKFITTDYLQQCRTDYDVYPLFMIKCDGLNDEEIQAAIERNLVEYTGMDADSIYIDDDGVCWHNGSCWYVDDTMLVSDEDAAHLERILGISTFK
nr:hypothetical protein [Escherichia coli]